jgi:hypothetical protein
MRARYTQATTDRASFADLEDNFLRIVAATVFCTVTTVDEQGRPRNRVLHPVFVVRDGAPLMRGEEYPLGALAGRVWHAA